MRAGVQPGIASPHNFDTQGALLQIQSVQIRDFQFTADGGLQSLGQLNNVLVVEIQTG